ncbi:T9SS type A sorting domain-containing protein [Polaribacter aestuariivivens]|uniref:T9SS type A sorting domain-containing protein n=1 Tax=Polaribacter aestuariivivens TaxID=2304626 RepID=A0A5S3N310_9FLAO|nr:zinc-dependent metalloprotease family protein [Polaribacter aestuariivivens]TMM29613.1 T9SS type A sorting domain-containing protein [Polaribacter aestuariivivens]
MKKITLILIFCFFTITILGQQQQWTLLSSKGEEIPKKDLMLRNDMPKKYQLYSLKTLAFKSKINTVKKSKTSILEIPTRNGLKKFDVQLASNFDEDLASKYTDIVAYSGIQVDDASIRVKFSKGLDGFHFSIYEPGKPTYYVDSYTKNSTKLIAYDRSNLEKEVSDFSCDVKEFKATEPAFLSRNANDGFLRTYRLALACTGEYAQFHLNRLGISASATTQVKKAAVLSAMNTSITRINGVFETELSVKLEIVANNEDIIFLDPATDNLTNDDTGLLINESQAVCDDVIGNANYDIGHTFSTGAGGFAGLGVICITGQKASGVTGISQPFGDEFDIDFVAHEFGHQFGANHTFNGTRGSCAGSNRNDATAVEPGSGSTIMGYAGICAPQNIQNDSDTHFHSISIDEMWAVISSTGTCGTATPTGNAAPTANAGLDFSIPKSTPFVLKGIGTDADESNVLTYNWEQTDNEVTVSIPPSSTDTQGAVFRSLPSSFSPNRYMPELSTVISGSTASTWEVVPSVARDLNFSLVVRDNNAGGGSSARDDMKVTVTDAEPFIVTSPNTAVVWDTGSTQTITWNKGTTDIAPINAQNVSIKLSVDGGLTFPIILKDNTPNDGAEEVVIPDNATNNARIMVEAADNIFYNVNSINFRINSTIPTFLISDESGEQFACNSGGDSASYSLDLDFLNGFSESVSFSTTNEPAGSTVTFSPSSINSDGTVVMTISNLDGKTPQKYTINIVAAGNTVSQNIDVALSLTESTFDTINLQTPTNGSAGVPVSETFTWEAEPNASTYDIEVATDSNFTNKIITENTPNNSYTSNILNSGTTYYWRVKPKNSCAEGVFSNTFNFTTEVCVVCTSVANTTYETSTTLVKFNTINNATPVKNSGYEDFTSISTTVVINSSYDLTINANTADDAEGFYSTKTLVWIDWNQNCSFTDPGEQYDLGTATATTNGATTLSPLTITVPSNANLGSTTMRVTTKFTGEGNPSSCEMGADAEVEDYTIIVDNVNAIPDNTFSEFNLYPNPSSGVINLKFDIEENSSDIAIQLFDVRGRLVSEKKFNNISNRFSEEISYENVSKGLYLVKISNGSKQTTKKLILR